jgi:hypothetical protein
MKPKTPSTALALPVTQPPPRKEDIINAMVERARVKHQTESDKLSAQKKAAEETLEKAVMEQLRSTPEAFESSVSCWGNSATIDFRIRVLPPHIKKLQEAVNKVPRLASFNHVEVKKQIREGMNTAGDRVKALLDNPEAVKKLDQALESIGA